MRGCEYRRGGGLSKEPVDQTVFAGEYEVRISDDISRLRCSNFAASTYRLVYAKGIQELNSNAALLGEFGLDCFNGGVFFTWLHFAKANEVAISSLQGFESKFGAVNATVSFDL